MGVHALKYSLFLLLVLSACGRSNDDSSVVNGKILQFTTNACVWDGKNYAVGEQLKDYDTCNTCFCKRRSNGDLGVACTLMACDLEF